jgi:hypothetical protein
VNGFAILPPFTAHFLYENHEKTYLAIAAFDNPRGDACDRGNEVAEPRSRNSIITSLNSSVSVAIQRGNTSVTLFQLSPWREGA